jgi:mono/diheme cytochrome c family protein
MLKTRLFVRLVVLLLAGSAFVSAYVQSDIRQPAALAAAPAAAAGARAVLNRYCISCHNDRLRTAGLALDTLDITRVGDAPAVWEQVILKLRAETMPPANAPRPDAATYRELAAWLEGEVDRAAAVHPNPGRTETFHRLNRGEYQNAIRDLLAVELDVSGLLPADNTFEHGFDNNADSLSVSPDLSARYLSAARKISRLAVGRPPIGPAIETYRVSPDLLQDERLSEDLPFGSRGGIAIHHYFPVNGEYVIKIRLQRNFSDYIKGFSTPHQIDVRLDRTLVKSLTVGGEAKGKMAPLSFSGNIGGDPEWEYYMNTGDAGLEVRFSAPAGRHLVGVSFAQRVLAVDGVLQPRQRGYGRFVDEYYDSNAAVEQVAIGGPYRNDGPGDTPSRRQIFVCRPPADGSLPGGAPSSARGGAVRPVEPGAGGSARAGNDESCARQILVRLAQRAYRRPARASEVDELLAFYRKGRAEDGFEAGIQFALERLLVDPDFLFRIERERGDAAPGSVYRLSDVELASRLSFFLWSSIPDDQLLEAATAGRLKAPNELARQARRMLADPRSRALVDNFAGQWLRLRNLRDQGRESAEYPEFDENLREAFRRETELFVESTLREDRSVVDLLSANYTYVNERLARHYGIPGILGDRFRRVTFGTDHPRGGLLGQGSVLMVTSHPNRTSPVLRGKWLLETILGAPPPEPPADVPGLPDRGEGGRPASVRERLELHRRNPVCASCHAPMDPLGFALENFDAIGGWRDVSEAGTPIDATGTLPSGVTFQGPSGLRAVLLTREDRFATTVTDRLLAYALGRGLHYYDRPTVRSIVRDSAADHYRWSYIIIGIVQSVPFQMRAAAAPDPVPSAAVAAR